MSLPSRRIHACISSCAKIDPVNNLHIQVIRGAQSMNLRRKLLGITEGHFWLYGVVGDHGIFLDREIDVKGSPR